MTATAGAMTTSATPPGRVSIVGLQGGSWFGPEARAAILSADVVVGAARHHDATNARLVAQEDVSSIPGERVELFGPLDEILDLIAERRTAGHHVVVLASGDPGFFGIARLLVGRFDDMVDIYPAPSSIALACARARVTWDDAAVVSCHGRALEVAIPAIVDAPKVAVLVSAANPPEAVGQALIAAHATHRQVWVCSRLGEPDESVTRTDLEGLAAGTFAPLSVVVLTSTPGHEEHIGDTAAASGPATLAWGRPIGEYRHRASLITKPEVRAVALSKLELFPTATMWDIGSASGSVAIEAARMAPGLRAFAIERDAELAADITANARRVAVSVVVGEAPACLADLPDPDRIFVGGGGVEVLAHSLTRLRPGGVAVATFAVVEAALTAAKLFGDGAQLVQLSVSRGVPIGPDDRLRLEAENPVFVVWGSR